MNKREVEKNRKKVCEIMWKIFDKFYWTWRGNKNSPTIKEIEKIIKRLEDNVIKNIEGMCETGRIMVLYDKEFDCFEYYINIIPDSEMEE